MKKLIGWFILGSIVVGFISIMTQLIGLIPAIVLIGGSFTIGGLIYLGVILVE